MNHFSVPHDLIIFVFPFFQDLVVDLLQSIVEIVTYGDRHDPAIFEYALQLSDCFQNLRVMFISSLNFADASWNIKY